MMRHGEIYTKASNAYVNSYRHDTRTRARAHTHTHARTHAHAHTHTHTHTHTPGHTHSHPPPSHTHTPPLPPPLPSLPPNQMTHYVSELKNGELDRDQSVGMIQSVGAKYPGFQGEKTVREKCT